MKKDIATREDIELLLKAFYDKILKDEAINYIFIDVAKMDIEKHIPVIADFWESVLLNKNIYHNNPMKIHVDLNEKTPLTKEHFNIWLSHFNTAVDELYTGEIALLAKQRAKSVATVMQIKMSKEKVKHKKAPHFARLTKVYVGIIALRFFFPALGGCAWQLPFALVYYIALPLELF
jgi:hemoglobin